MLIELNRIRNRFNFNRLYRQIIFYAYKHRLAYLIFPDKLNITIHNLFPTV
jgi:hypothetical protein